MNSTEVNVKLPGVVLRATFSPALTMEQGDEFWAALRRCKSVLQVRQAVERARKAFARNVRVQWLTYPEHRRTAA